MGNSLLDGTSIRAHIVGDQLEVMLLISRFDAPVFSDRSPDAVRYFQRWVSKGAAISEFPVAHVCRFSPGEQRDLWRRLRKIDDRLTALIDAPVSPRAVERYLRISGRERNRWMKDGRLPPSSHVRSARTKETFRVHYFAVALISDLCTKPWIIQSWREADVGLGS